MTTRRRTTCFILSALLFSACAFLADEAPQRVVRVKALADPALRERNSRWEDELRGLVEAASDYFEEEFGIRFVTQSTAAWPAQDRIPSTPDVLVRLKQDFPLKKNDGNYDLIIAFTAEAVSRHVRDGRPRVDRIGDCRQGLGSYVVTNVSTPFLYTGVNREPTPDVIALIHELGHIFGAEHVDDTKSIMHEEFGYRTGFDDKNRSVILKNRKCPFAK